MTAAIDQLGVDVVTRRRIRLGRLAAFDDRQRAEIGGLTEIKTGDIAGRLGSVRHEHSALLPRKSGRTFASSAASTAAGSKTLSSVATKTHPYSCIYQRS